MHELGRVLYEMFWWPGGIVVGNLIASVMWAAPTFLHLHHKLNRQHREHAARLDRLEGPAGVAVQAQAVRDPHLPAQAGGEH